MAPKNNPAGQDTRSFIETARRAQIVECAIEVIAELGYTRASLDQIAQRAGISRGLISYHFAGRDELIAEVIRVIYESGAAFMLPRIKAAATSRERLRAYIESNLAYMREHRSHMLAVVQIIASISTVEGVPGHGAFEVEQSVKNLGAILRRGQKAGEFRQHDARVMAIAIRNAIDGVPAQMAGNPKLDLDAYARELVTLFDRATAAAPDADNGDGE